MTLRREEIEALLSLEIGRRGLLRASASGLALWGLAVLLPVGCRGYPQPPARLRFFSPEEYAVFQTLAAVMLGLDRSPVDVAAEADRLIAEMDPSVQQDIHWILRIFEHGTHLFDLKGKRFTRLSRAEQERYLEGWMKSSLGARRIVFRALKLVCALGYYTLPQTWMEIGYDGPWVGRRDEKGRFDYEPAVPVAPESG
jgi:hypothetical protein